jgi:hypothetical protein
MPFKEGDVVTIRNSPIEYRIEQLDGELANLVAVLREGTWQKVGGIHVDHLNRRCVCRTCAKHYNLGDSRADLQGFCSAQCQHKKAKSFGYKKGVIGSEYATLKKHDAVGSLYVQWTDN